MPGALLYGGLNTPTPALGLWALLSPPASPSALDCPCAFPFPWSLPGAQHPGSDSALLRQKERHPSTPPRCPRPRPGQVRAVTGGKPGGAGGKCKPAVIKGIFQTAPCAELFRDTAGTDVHAPDPRRTQSPAPPPLWKDSEMIQPEERWPSARPRVSAVISLGCLCLQLCAWKRNRGRHRRPGEGEQSPPARCHRAVPCSCSTSAGPGWRWDPWTQPFQCLGVSCLTAWLHAAFPRKRIKRKKAR